MANDIESLENIESIDSIETLEVLDELDNLDDLDNRETPEDLSPLTPADRQPPQSQWRRWHLPVLILFVVAAWIIVTRHRAPVPFQHDEGAVFGTFYHITYQSDENLRADIEAQLSKVDASLSMFNPQSTLSRINQGDSVQADSLFRDVFSLSQRVSQATGGAFDITVAPLVNAWGFGFKHDALPDSAAVDSLRNLVGWQRIRLTSEGYVSRDDPRIVLDCGAVAKGFGVDVVARYLRMCGIQNYMVEIGGEVVVSGHNPKGESWRVGINSPVENPESTGNQLDTILTLTDCAMATSGNYRNFYITPDGRKLAHTIDPHTGYPVRHSILSATVLAPSCAEADAFATACMVLGVDSARVRLANQSQLQLYLIYDSLGHRRIFSTLR